MSKDSISELPVHYGEVTKDGIKIERPSEDAPRRQSSDDTPSPGRQNRQSAIIIHQASLGAPDQQIPARRSKDETSAEGDDYPRTKTRPPHGLEIARSGLARSDYRQSFRDRRGHDDFDRYSDDDDYDDPYYRPQRIRDRPYYTEDEYVPRRRPSHASRQSYRYPRDRYPRTMDDYSDGPRTPRKYYAQRKSTTSRGPPIVHESDGDEEVIYPKDTSPGVNRQIKFKDLSKEERKEIMRLPWVQWMDSDTKNRKYYLHAWTASCRQKLIYRCRLRRHARRVHRHDHVSVVCLCWNTSREHPVGRFGQQLDFGRCHGFLCHFAALHCGRLWLLLDGECLGVLSYLGRSLQSCCECSSLTQTAILFSEFSLLIRSHSLCG